MNAHPNGGVKEQVAGLYSQRMAEQGYICLAFDAAYQGAREGQPRNVDKPSRRVEDIRRAADILSQYPGVDPLRLRVLGICGGEGYTLKAAQMGKRFRGRRHTQHVQHRAGEAKWIPRQPDGQRAGEIGRCLRSPTARSGRRGA